MIKEVEVIKEIEVLKEVEVVKEAPVEVATPVEIVREVVIDKPDDLKKIKGIGKVYEGILNDAGITHFAQMASLTPDEIQEAIWPRKLAKHRP